MSKKNSFTPLKPLNPKQAKLIQSIYTKDMTIVSGPAGTGKTYITASLAAQFYHENKVERIILTRPTVPCGKTIGYFPGELLEKLAPWTYPITSVLEQFLSRGEVECLIKNDKLQVIPFEVIRGRSWDNSFIILDEAQNTTPAEALAFITRIGKNSKVVMNGDPQQTDIKTDNGLDFVCDLVSRHRPLQERVDWIQFNTSEIVRSDLCKLFIEAMGGSPQSGLPRQ